MLVLSRKENEKVIVLCAGIRFEIVHLGFTSFGSVKLGFNAPKEVVIMREELMRDYVPPANYGK